MARELQVHAEQVGYKVIEVYPGGTYVAQCTEPSGCDGYQTPKSTSTGRPLERPMKAHRRDKHGDE